MRVVVTSVMLVLSAGIAFAQTGSIVPAPATPVDALQTGKSAVAEAKAECMRLWDAGTHMSKQQWSATCDRIQTRLDNLKVDNLDVMGTGVRKKTGAGKQGSADLPSRTN